MKPQNVKGTRDIVGKDAILLNRIISTVKGVFEKYGFQPFYVSALENAETLKTKISDEMLGLIYEFKDKAGRSIGLRYDLTLGLARVAATSQLSMPFKRYQIARAWRYEAPQAGRYREFWQADIDVLGVENSKADAECLVCVSEVLENIGIKNFIIRVNSRGLLEQISDKLKLGKERVKVFQIIDKGDKIGKQEVARELEMLLGKGKAKELLTLLESDLITVKKSGYSMGDIDNLLKYAKFYGISDKVEVDLSLVRGLAYYTGLIFEVSVGEKQSIAGGGR